MGIAEPLRLVALLAVVALAVAYAAAMLRRRQAAVRFSNVDLLDSVLPKRSGWRRHVPAAGLLLALVLMIVAYAEPTMDQQVPRERATIMLALDTSLSMGATDVDPDRLSAAREAALAFLASAPEAVNIGIVSFDGTAIVQSSPTTDRVSLARIVENLQLGEGTAIGDAILASLRAIDAQADQAELDEVPAAIIVMSDGFTTMGTPDEIAVPRAIDAGIPVSTIAFGTPAGTVTIPIEPGGPATELVPVPVNPEALSVIADATGGEAFEADTAGELTDIYDRLGSAIGFENVPTDISEWFLAAAIAMLVLASLAALAWTGRLP